MESKRRLTRRVAALVFFVSFAHGVCFGETNSDDVSESSKSASDFAPRNLGTSDAVDYRVLATTRTGTMERELNEYARHGFVLTSVMGGETEYGGEELVAIMEYLGSASEYPYEYLVLATSRTSTMEKEMRDAARSGFVFVGQTVYSSAFGGDEVIIVMERNPKFEGAFCEYSLLATNATSTMENELIHYADRGFLVKDMSVARTAFGGQEIVVAMERCPLEP